MTPGRVRAYASCSSEGSIAVTAAGAQRAINMTHIVSPADTVPSNAQETTAMKPAAVPLLDPSALTHRVSTAPATGSLKLGQPVPLSNFFFDTKRGWLHPAQTNVPGRFS